MTEAIADPIADALVAQLADDPRDVARLAILADHLQTRDDPRGELIALELATRDGNRDTQLAHRRGELMHALAPPLEPADDVTWGIGFIRALDLAARPWPAIGKLGELWRHPSLALLSELAIEVTTWGGNRSLPDLVAQLPVSLRTFHHASGNGDRWHELGQLARLPRLEELAFCGTAAFVELVHPRLRRLELAHHAPFAQLVALEPRALPALSELAFRGTQPARDFDYLLYVQVAKGWLVRVTLLGLLAGELTALGIAQLEAGLAGRRLAELDLTGTRIHAAMKPRLAALCERLVAPSVIAPELVAYVEHADRPEWGRGHVVRRFDGKVEIEFPAVGRRVFRADDSHLRYGEA